MKSQQRRQMINAPSSILRVRYRIKFMCHAKSHVFAVVKHPCCGITVPLLSTCINWCRLKRRPRVHNQRVKNIWCECEWVIEAETKNFFLCYQSSNYRFYGFCQVHWRVLRVVRYQKPLEIFFYPLMEPGEWVGTSHDILHTGYHTACVCILKPTYMGKARETHFKRVRSDNVCAPRTLK